jgi:hypothetical protein
MYVHAFVRAQLKVKTTCKFNYPKGQGTKTAQLPRMIKRPKESTEHKPTVK